MSAKHEVSFNGLVLAGGLSSRMGQDKALLQCPDGDTLLQRCTKLLRNTGANQVFISSHNPRVPGALCDHYSQQGPVSGIHAALQVSQSSALLVLPVDMPLMSQDVLQQLLQTGFNRETSCCFRDQCLPLFIREPVVAFSRARELLSGTQNVSVWRFIRAIAAIEIDTASQQCFKNANDPEQWLECQSLMSS